MDSNPFEEVKSKSDSTSFLSMTVCADVKALTEHMMFLMLQIASSRKTVRRRGGFFFLLAAMAENSWMLFFPRGRSKLEQKRDSSLFFCYAADLSLTLYIWMASCACVVCCALKLCKSMSVVSESSCHVFNSQLNLKVDGVACAVGLGFKNLWACVCNCSLYVLLEEEDRDWTGGFRRI